MILKTTIFLLFISSVAFGAQFKCHTYGQYCDIYKLDLTRENYEIVPVANQKRLNACTQLRLYGKVPVLSATEICKAMPNLKNFYASWVSMEEIGEKAFDGCENLESLSLNVNKFLRLDRNSFKGLPNLKSLYIGGGNISVIDLDLTDLANLENITLNQLNITVFPAEVLREQKNLKELNLNSNNLFDMDVETLVEYLPMLETLHLGDNNFECTRIQEILSILSPKGIKSGVWTGNLRERDYDPDEVEEIQCLPESIWDTEIKKCPHKAQIDEIREKRRPKIDETLIERKIAAQLTVIQKEQDAKISNLEEKLNEGMKEMHKKSEEAFKRQDEKVSGLENKLDQVLEILNKRNNPSPNPDQSAPGTTSNSVLDSKIEQYHMIQTNQTKEISNQINEVQKGLNDNLQSLNATVVAQDAQITEMKITLDNSLESFTKFIEEQNTRQNEANIWNCTNVDFFDRTVGGQIANLQNSIQVIKKQVQRSFEGVSAKGELDSKYQAIYDQIEEVLEELEGRTMKIEATCEAAGNGLVS